MPNKADNQVKNAEAFRESKKAKAKISLAGVPNYSRENIEALLEIVAEVEPPGPTSVQWLLKGRRDVLITYASEFSSRFPE